METIFYNENDNKAELDFNTIYKTADIVVCQNRQGLDYLQNTNIDGKISVFKMAEHESSLPFYNWKNFNNKASGKAAFDKNHPSIYKVDDNIQLFPDNIKTTMGYDFNLGIMSDLTKSGVFGTIQNLAVGAAQFNAIYDFAKSGADIDKIQENLKYQDRVNIFKNVPYFQDISTSSIDNISFTFNWGQYGLYNCELEVIKPIFALANCFGCSIDANGFVTTPFDAKFEVTTKAYAALFSKGDKMVDSIIKDIKNGNAINQSDTGITKLTKSLNELYSTAVGQTSLTGALFRIGGGIFGPVYISDVTWEFDYSQQDEYGMPFKGKITLGGIKPIIIEDMSSMALSGGVRIDK